MCTANCDLEVNVMEHRSQLSGFSDTCDHLEYIFLIHGY